MLFALLISHWGIAQEATATDVEELIGSLPKSGNLSDILKCAGANEVVWTTIIKEDPYSRVAHEAKRKAGWYAAIALWVFAVDTQAVIDAVNSARERQYNENVELAKKCRKAPKNWVE